MNSVIEAQEEFTSNFGELRLSHLLEPNFTLPHFTNEYAEMQQFLEDHRKPAPIKIVVTETQYLDATVYNQRFQPTYGPRKIKFEKDWTGFTTDEDTISHYYDKQETVF